MSAENLTKKCCICKIFKPVSTFHKNATKSDGIQSACKICSNRRSAVHEKTDKSKQYQSKYQPKYQSEYRKSSAGKIAIAKAMSKYNEENPIKIKAKDAVKYAVISGRLIRPDNCESCPNTGGIEGHHDDYSLPLVVRWLCRGCHNAWHAANGHGLNG